MQRHLVHGVDGFFGQANGYRRAGGNLGGEFHRFGQVAFGGHHAVDQAEAGRFVGAQAAVVEDHFHGQRFAHGTG